MSSNMIKGYSLNYDRTTVKKLDLSKEEEEINNRAQEMEDRRRENLNAAKALGFIPGIEASVISEDDIHEVNDLDEIRNVLSDSFEEEQPEEPEAVPQVDVTALREEIRNELIEECKAEAMEQARTELEQEADAILNDANQKAENILAEATERGNAEAEAAKAGILAIASQQGYEDGLKRAKAEEEAAIEALESQKRELKIQYERQVAELEPAFVKILQEYLRKITGMSYEKYSGLFKYLIDKGINAAPKDSDFTVYLSKEDHDRFSPEFDSIAADYADKFKLNFAVDRELESGNFRLENDSTIVECGLGPELRGLIESLDILMS